jgi:hypothetical protein
MTDAVTNATMDRITSMVSIARSLTKDDSDAITAMLGAAIIIARGYGDKGAVQVVDSMIDGLVSARARLLANLSEPAAPAAMEAL